MDPRLTVNLRNWNERTPVHAASEFYDVEGFKAGRSSLNDIERREVGDVSGKSLLHLQCHFGLDTMSWARLGAEATGVDFSDAIDLARSLNDELELGARFIRANVYDLPTLLDERFDIVYVSLGALCWLPDLDRWAQVVAGLLRPGGCFYIMDVHPFVGVLDSAAHEGEPPGIEDLQLRYPYFPAPDGMFFAGGEPSYAGEEIIESGCYEWAHSIAEILNAIHGVGLRLAFFHEFPMTCYRAFPGMTRGADGWWRFADGGDRLPLMFSLKAQMPKS